MRQKLKCRDTISSQKKLKIDSSTIDVPNVQMTSIYGKTLIQDLE